MNAPLLGTGSYSHVRLVDGMAVKTIPGKFAESAIREVYHTKRCVHPNIIAIEKFTIGLDESLLYMRRYDCDLAFYMNRGELMPVESVYSIAKDLITAVEHMHTVGVIHGDLKPQNLLMDGSEHIVVCDFGIALAKDERYHISKIQTVTYRAPEVDYERKLGRFSERVDMWSVGCILLELATGSPTLKYVDGIEDSSIYACKLFGIPELDSRQKRLQSLRRLTYESTLKALMERIDLNTNRNRTMIRSGFINLIARCLKPDRRKRIDSGLALYSISHIHGSSSYPTPSRPALRRRSLSDMHCFSNLGGNVIKALKDSSLELAELAYNRYAKKMHITTSEDRYSCVYLAVCIFSGSVGVIPGLTTTHTHTSLRMGAARIFMELEGSIL